MLKNSILDKKNIYNLVPFLHKNIKFRINQTLRVMTVMIDQTAMIDQTFNNNSIKYINCKKSIQLFELLQQHRSVLPQLDFTKFIPVHS